VRVAEGGALPQRRNKAPAGRPGGGGDMAEGGDRQRAAAARDPDSGGRREVPAATS